MNELQKHLPATCLYLVILILGSYYLFSGSMDTYPSYIHAWTQSDRLAIAMNFQENGFNLFKPATYNLLTKDGITQVDFPIHEFLIAGISKLLDANIIYTFRWYNLIYALFGFLFLFRTSLLINQSSARSVFIGGFIFTMPFLVYYTNGFLPSNPSLANFYIGTYFLFHYLNNNRFRSLIYSAAFLSLSALSRSPFVIFLFTSLLLLIYRQWKSKKYQLIAWLPYSIGLILFTAYFAYNMHLGSKYGSMFLNESLHFRGFGHFMDTIAIAWDRWGAQWISPYHLISILIFAFLLFKFPMRQLPIKEELKTYLIISSLGVLAYFFVMGQQFGEHDYYYLDSFLPLVSIALIASISAIQIRKRWYTPIATLLGVFFIYFFTYAKDVQEIRYTPPYKDRVDYAYQLYEKSIDDLQHWGVKATDTLYIIEANSTNIPFTVWKNKGFTNLYASADTIKKELDRSFNYALLVDSFFIESTFDNFPGLIQKLERIAGNGELSLYRNSNSNQPDGFFENLIYYGETDFDDQDMIPDSVTAWTEEVVVNDSMGKSLHIKPNNEFTLSFPIKLNNILEDKAIRIHLLGDFMQKDSSKIRIVNSVNGYYKCYYLENHLAVNDQWKHFQFNYWIAPKHFNNGDDLKLYFWNPEEDELYVDNLKLLIYQ